VSKLESGPKFSMLRAGRRFVQAEAEPEISIFDHQRKQASSSSTAVIAECQ